MPEIGRRALLIGAGAGAGLLLSRGLGVHGLGAPRGEPGYAGALRDFAASLTAGQRELIVLPADHPSRQVTNTVAFLDRPHLGTLLSPSQRVLAERLCQTMLSPRGHEANAGTFAVEGRFEGCVLAVYGDPERGRAQAQLMGGHVHLRGGGESEEGAPLGGAVAYGHQVGNQQWRVPGNSFAYHSDAANRFFSSLSQAERARAVLAQPPHELMVQPLGLGVALPGVRVGDVGPVSREAAEALLETVLGLYPDPRRAAVRDAIDANGGLDSLHVATYASRGFYEDMTPVAQLSAEERQRRGEPYWQVWRIEGPGTVIHFQGHPHVHAYVNVERDPARVRIGETLGETTTPVQGEAMRSLVESALRRASGEALAWHPESVPARFCPGRVTTGLVWALDPYDNRVVVAEIEGRAMAEPLRERLAAGGLQIEPGRVYRVATFGYFASRSDYVGDPRAVEESDVLVRDAVLAHLRAGGLGSSDA